MLCVVLSYLFFSAVIPAVLDVPNIVICKNGIGNLESVEYTRKQGKFRFASDLDNRETQTIDVMSKCSESKRQCNLLSGPFYQKHGLREEKLFPFSVKLR